MAWIPIQKTLPQYVDGNGNPYSGAVLKAYAEGTSSNISFATDDTGTVQVSSIALNSSGYPEVSANEVIPHIDQNYKLSLYPDQSSADSDTGAIWTIDNITVGLASDVGGAELTSVGDATARTSAVNAGQIQDNIFGDLGTTGGSADQYTLTPSIAITAYVATMEFTAKISATNLTTTPYLQISGIANPSTNAVIKKLSASKTEIAVEVGDLAQNGIYTFKRNASNDAWIVKEPENSIKSSFSGMVSAFALETPPIGWLECDGSAVSRTTYDSLFNAIGVRFGTGDGSTTFNLPDLRGEFIRGWDNGAGNDPDSGSRTDSGDGTVGNNVGTKQNDAFQGHYHNLLTNQTSGTAGAGFAYTTQTQDATRTDLVTSPVTDGTNGTPRTASETRPTNIYMMYCIKT